MGESVTIDEITAEIVAYLSEPDYFELGWRQTRDIADAAGITVELAYKRLSDSPRYEKKLDKSRRAWWRVKV